MNHRSIRLGSLFVGLICLLGVTGLALADSDLDVGVQVRWRPETERTVVSSQAMTEAVQHLRTRVTLDFAPGATTHARVMLQDSRTLGVMGSGSLANDTNAGVHEAYLKIDEFFHPNLMLQAGRFELVYGNQRLLGAVGWSNVGRTFDAARVSVVQPAWQLDVFRGKLFDRVSTPGRPNDGADLYGAHMHLKEANADVFGLLDYVGAKVPNTDDRRLNRFTVGTYSARDFGSNLDYITNAAFQFGTHDSTDISAYMVAVELGLTGGGEKKMRAAVGIDLASGDSDSTFTGAGVADDDDSSFSNLYYTGHKFRGIMDQFVSSNRAGLMDIYGKVGFMATPAWWLGADVHFFRTAAEYTVTSSTGTTSETSAVGIEIDVRAKTKQLENATLEIGGSVFMPDADFAAPAEDDMEMWGYMAVTVNLP